jgi:sigma-B regulation protein RsbU (phosphoserine phosphatase)
MDSDKFTGYFSNVTPTILVIEDSRIDALLLDKILSKEGFRVLLARDGQEGRHLAQTEQPDLILLDVMMPNLDGFDTCSLLKQNPETMHIPVIFVTGVTATEEKIKAFHLGAVDYVTKPFNREEILARTRIHLKLYRAYQLLIHEHRERLMQAAAAQQALLIDPATIPEAQFSVVYLPANQVSGDYYDVIKVGEHIYSFIVADICGHDLGASFSTSALRAFLHQQTNPLFVPIETLTLLNEVMREVLAEGRFLTMGFAQINRSSRHAKYITAGHPPMIHLNREGCARLVGVKGDILGAFARVYLEEVDIEILPGDRCFLFTDGLIENIEGKRQVAGTKGYERLLSLCENTRGIPLYEALIFITQKLAPSGAVEDDILLLGIEV